MSPNLACSAIQMNPVRCTELQHRHKKMGHTDTVLYLCGKHGLKSLNMMWLPLTMQECENVAAGYWCSLLYDSWHLMSLEVAFHFTSTCRSISLSLLCFSFFLTSVTICWGFFGSSASPFLFCPVATNHSYTKFTRHPMNSL